MRIIVGPLCWTENSYSLSISPEIRAPDPERLLSAYFHSTTTLNYIQSLLASGFASLSHSRDWSLSHVCSSALKCVIVLNQVTRTDLMRLLGWSLNLSLKGLQMPLTSAGPSVLKPKALLRQVEERECWLKLTSIQGNLFLVS